MPCNGYCAETLGVDLAFGVLLGAVYVNLDAWFEPLLARGVYRDSIESSGLGFGLVNHPECDFGYIYFLMIFIVDLVLDLAWLFILLAEYLWVETMFGLDNGYWY